MLCSNCKKEIPEDSVFCAFCGSPVTKAPTETYAPSAPTENYVPSAPAEPAPAVVALAERPKPAKKRSKAWIFIAAGAAAICLCVVALVLIFSNRDVLSKELREKISVDPKTATAEEARGVLDAVDSEAMDALGSSVASVSQTAAYFFGGDSLSAVDPEGKLGTARDYILDDMEMSYIAEDASSSGSAAKQNSGGEEEVSFKNAKEAYNYIEETAGISPDVTAALGWLSEYDSAHDSTVLLEVFKPEIEDEAVTGAKRELLENVYLSRLEDCIAAEFYGEDRTRSIIEDYVLIGAADFETKILEAVQEEPTSDFSATLIDVLNDHGKNSAITAETIYKSCIVNDSESGVYDELDVYEFLLAVQKICFEDGEDNGRSAKALELAANDEGYTLLCSRYSQLKDFIAENGALFDFLESKIMADSSYELPLEILNGDELSSDIKDMLYDPEHEALALDVKWDSDMMEDYYGSETYVAAHPKQGKFLIVYDSDEKEGMQWDARNALTSAGLTETMIPDDAAVIAYVSEYYTYYSLVNTSGDSTYRPCYSAYAKYKFVNNVTGKVIGTLTVKNTPQIGGTDFYVDTNASGTRSYFMYFPSLTSSETATLKSFAATAAAITVSSGSI